MPFFITASVMLVMLCAVVAILWQINKSRQHLENWAAQNHFELLSVERRRLRTGPFFFRASREQEVFHITVRDSEGRTRKAYARTGSWLVGQLSDRVDVEWE